MRAAELLTEAAVLVGGKRSRQHGPVRQNLGLAAKLWSVYLGVPIEAADVAMLMALIKVARARTGAPLSDHFVDMAGYAAIAGELALARVAVAP